LLILPFAKEHGNPYAVDFTGWIDVDLKAITVMCAAL